MKKKKNPGKTAKNPCQGCTTCCEHVAIEIDKPTTRKDFEEILWFIIHQKVWVWVDDDGSWQVQFDGRCRWLKNGQCVHYEFRPQICKDYKVDDCYRNGEEEIYKYSFREPEDLWKYLRKKKPKIFKKMKTF